MTKKVSVALIAGLMFASLMAPGQAAGPHRTQQYTYRVPAGVIIPGVTGTVQLGNNLAHFKVLSGERTVTFSIDDASGRPVLGYFSGSRFDGQFCTATDKPLKVRPGDTVYVGAMIGSCEDGRVSTVTTGTITATFSR